MTRMGSMEIRVDNFRVLYGDVYATVIVKTNCSSVFSYDILNF